MVRGKKKKKKVMPFPMKVQPIDAQQEFRESSKPPVLKSRLKRLFDRPFNSVLRISSAASDKAPVVPGEVKDVGIVEFEPSSVCLDKMVQNFIEENTFERVQQTQKCGRNRCNCFNGNSNDSSDDEFDFAFGDSVSNTSSSFGDYVDTVKSLIPCSTTVERNLLADISKMVEKNKTCKRKDDLRTIVTDGLLSLGFNASICKSKWEKTSSIPAGEYEYIDVIVEGERVLIDVDFRSEFEIARSTSSYKSILQSLPFIFVGKADRLQQIIAIVSEAARQSLKKKGMHVAPWRKAEYIRSKWLSPHVRTTTAPTPPSEKVTEPAAEAEEKPQEEEEEEVVVEGEEEKEAEPKKSDEDDQEEEEEEEKETVCGELELIFGETETSLDEEAPKSNLSSPAKNPRTEEEKGVTPATVTWQPPVIKPKSCERGNRVVVTGLASLLIEKP